MSYHGTLTARDDGIITHNTTSFPGSLFSATIVVETEKAEKRDPGNEVDDNVGLEDQGYSL